MKKTIFFMDIMGTIFGDTNNIEADYDKFGELLKQIKEQDGADEIIFSLISTDNINVVRNAENTIKPYIRDTVSFGRQYFDKGYYVGDGDDGVTLCTTTSKAVSIVNYLNELLSDCDDIGSIYYLDDVEMYHVMLKHLITKGLSERELSNKLHCVRPVNNHGLSETNELLKISIESKMTDTIKI